MGANMHEAPFVSESANPLTKAVGYCFSKKTQKSLCLHFSVPYLSPHCVGGALPSSSP